MEGQHFRGVEGWGISERLKKRFRRLCTVGVLYMYDELNSIFRDRVMVQCGLTYFEGTERPLSQAGFKGDLDTMFDRDGGGKPRIAERRSGGEAGSARY